MQRLPREARNGSVKNGIVLCRRAEFCNGRDVVESFTEGPNNDEIAALVCEEAHNLIAARAGVREKYHLFVGKRISRISYSSLYIFAG